MESKENSVKENQSECAINQKNATEIERSFVVESKISAVESTSEEKKFTKNSFRKETAKESNGILKETASESHFRRVNDTKKVDNSDREREKDTVAKITIVDQLDKSHLRDELLSDEFKREIKNPKRIDDAAMTGGRRHQRPFHDIIGKREQRREELEKMEGNLRQRLDMLECSMPAVMVWNIWRMSQGTPVCRMKRILEKQLKDTKELACRSTPSRHYDCRVREVEAERKLALKKVEEARTLWSEKLARLEERKKKLEEARKIQEEQKNAIERLNEEVKALRESLEKSEMDGEFCEHGECGDTRCKRRRIGKVSSVTSVNSGDIRCLEKLQRLAEEEMIMKRDIIELERREEAYMRTLQQADELWSKMEGDTVSVTNALQEQLDMKTAANQQLAERVCELEDALEKCRTRLAACAAELEKFTSVERVAATVGRDDDVAEVTDKEVAVRAKVLHRPIGRVDDVATVKDKEVLARVEVADKKTWAKAESADVGMLARIDSIDADAEVAFVGDDKYVSVKPDLVDLAVDRSVDLARIEDAESAVEPEDFAYKQQQFKEVREYLAKLGSLEELYKDDGEPCPPDFICNDVVSSPIGITDEELSMLGVELAAPTKEPEKLIASEDDRDEQFRKKLTSDVDDIGVKEKEANEILAIETEKKVVEKAEKAIIEVEDAPVKEIVTIREKTTDDRSVTMLNDVSALEVKKIEADRDIVIQRNTILSWVNTIDAIRTKAAKHPNCHAAKKDADILAEQVGAYIGIKPKKVEEEDVTIITEEDKQKKAIEKNEITVTNKIETENKRDNEKIGFLPEARTELPKNNTITKIQIEPIILSKISAETTEADTKRREKANAEEEIIIKTKLQNESISFPKETTSAEKEALMKPVAELESLPDLPKEEISASVEPPTATPIEDSFQSLTIPVEKDLKDDTVLLSEPIPNKIGIERIEAEKETEVNEIVEITKENETSRVEEVVRENVIGTFIDKKLTVERVVSDKIMNSIDKEKPSVIQNAERIEDEIISVHVEKIKEKVEDMPKIPEERKVVMKKITVDEVLSASKEIDESKLTKDAVEKLKEASQLDQIRMTDVEETTPHVKVAEMKEIAETLPVAEIKEIKRVNAKEATVDAREIKEYVPETISPPAHLTEVEKFESSEVSIMDVEQIPTADVTDMAKEKVQIEESLIVETKEEKVEVEQPPVLNAVRKEKIESEEPTPLTDIISEKPEITESLPTTDIEKEKTIKEKPLLIADTIIEEEIKIKEPPTIAEAVTEERIEMIETITEPSLIITKKTEIEVTEPVLEIEKEKHEKIIEIPEKITPPIEIRKERKEEEEIPRIEKENMLEEVALLSVELMVEDKKEETPMIVIEKKPEIEVEERIPIIEIKSAEEEMSTIPIDFRLAAQPYFVIAKIEERELLQIIPAIKPLRRPPVGTAKPTEATRTDVVQTEIVQSEIVQTEIAPAEVAQTKFVQITAQTISTSEAPRTPPIQILSEYLKPAELKASSTEFAGDHPEITGRKMLWRKRLKDQSTVTTASIEAQTDKTSHVSHDRVVRDERERARVPTDELLRSIKIAAAGLTRPDIKREIRTINYGGRSEEKETCNCCLCGEIPSSSSTRPRLEVPPQIDVKIATPPATAACKCVFPLSKIDRSIWHDKLCPDCKTKIQDKMSREKHHIGKIIKKMSRDPESCGCASLIDKSCRAVSRKKAIEKKDQSCLAKIRKRKTNIEQKKTDDLQSILADSKKSDIEPLSSSCICFKLDKTGVEPIRKGNCYCAD
ncbi:uncharacterized protein [Linepithema humile]|uniref:uncharacterized protein n=1 Tax=Linepithema humile TaxID=83485 RepID=UPI00351E6B9A